MFSHIDPNGYEQQLSDKQQQMTKLFAEFNGPDFELYSSEPINYRQRAEFRLWHDGDDLYYIMFDSKTKQKFKVTDFPVASILVNQLMSALLVQIKDNWNWNIIIIVNMQIRSREPGGHLENLENIRKIGYCGKIAFQYSSALMEF